MQRFLVGAALVGAGIAFAFFLNRRDAVAPDRDAAPGRDSGAVSTVDRSLPDQPFADGGVTHDAGAEFDSNTPSFDLGDLDYDALRQQTPDSLYWLMAAPSKDPEVLEARRRAREERNQQYGKVVSNTASVEEIRNYYAYRRQLSEDYVEVMQLILDQHGDELPERDVGLLELALAMHSSLLSELPKKEDDALQRKTEYDRVKRAWQQQQLEAHRPSGTGESSP
ncbi:MAG: hypothetical protein WBM46_09300 [Polyangiales bacterium]|jgi:flagellar biosynthesis chaperone FliJ